MACKTRAMAKGGRVPPKPEKKPVPPKTNKDVVGDGGRLDSMDPRGYKKGGKVKKGCKK